MKRFNQCRCLLAAAIAMGICASAQADPPAWAPAHGKRAKQEYHAVERGHRYVYYPEQQVYYSPEQQLWFWMNGGNWQFDVSLPAQYRLQATTGISVTLDATRPYIQHAYVEERYGRPWREQQHGNAHAANDRHKEKHHRNSAHD